MRDPERICKVLELLKTEWEKYPDLRLGQILVNIVGADTECSFSCPEVFYYEDDELIKYLENKN